jgi:curved DNA-binding protein CbpA
MKDYYDILGISPNASKEDIKRAYHILAAQFHPDKANGNERRFKEVNEAYRILYSIDSRTEYDREYSASKANSREGANVSDSEAEKDKVKQANVGIFFPKKQFLVFLSIAVLFVIGFGMYIMLEGKSYVSNKKPLALTIQTPIASSHTSELKDENSWLDKMPVGTADRYGAEVLQIGGSGSRITQKTVYLLTEQGYLKPSDDWVYVSFNRPADIMDVGCRDGYVETSCVINGRKSAVDKIFGCRGMPLENKIQNSVVIECHKNN